MTQPDTRVVPPLPTSEKIASRQAKPKSSRNSTEIQKTRLFISSFKNGAELAGDFDVKNLMHLQSCLQGRAKKLDKSKPLDLSSVGEIIQTLEYILDSMIEEATKIPNLKDKLEGIIEYALTIINMCSTMEACYMMAYLHNPLLVKILVDKLPSNHKLNWAIHTKYACQPSRETCWMQVKPSERSSAKLRSSINLFFM